MLTSAEVGNLVTALGCGIGASEFNADKLRYHSIIIMTDADVDGSHIRTLLLTFFFRHMRELLERGHVFIAQPPLYKIAKGKQHSYLKDDDELDSFLIQVALEKAALHINAEAPPIAAEALGQMVGEYRAVTAMVERLAQRYPSEVLTLMIDQPELSEAALADKAAVETWCSGLEANFTALHKAGQKQFAIAIHHDRERQIYLPKALATSHGVTKEAVFGHEFFHSSEYRAIVAIGEKISDLIEEGGFIRRGEKQEAIASFPEALDWLMHEAKRGYMIQRYKGLGEMNPNQLWETTMDPEVRRMLRVSIDDAIAADLMFTTLMGDQVEPRRAFIEKNALTVANLDI